MAMANEAAIERTTMADFSVSLAAVTAAISADERRAALRSVHVTPTDVASLLEAAPTLTALLADADIEVRRLALGLVEEAGKECADLLPVAIGPVTARLTDASPLVVKRALAAASTLHRPTLSFLVACKDVAAGARTWQELRDQRSQIVAMVQGAPTDALRTAAARFCETLVLAYSPPDVDGEAGAAAAAGGWSLDLLADEEAHPFLERAELAADCQQLVDLLRSALLEPSSATALLGLMTTWTSLAKQRRSVLSPAAAALCELQRRLVGRAPELVERIPQAQLGNAQQSLKSALLTMLKLPYARDETGAEAAVAVALRALGGAEQVKFVFRQQGREGYALPDPISARLGL